MSHDEPLGILIVSGVDEPQGIRDEDDGKAALGVTVRGCFLRAGGGEEPGVDGHMTMMLLRSQEVIHLVCGCLASLAPYDRAVVLQEMQRAEFKHPPVFE